MSDTPRTDAAELDGADFSDWGTGPSGYCRAEFARTLERELAEQRTKLIACVPKTWLDSLLTGPDAALQGLPWETPEIEALLQGICTRMEAVK